MSEQRGIGIYGHSPLSEVATILAALEMMNSPISPSLNLFERKISRQISGAFGVVKRKAARVPGPARKRPRSANVSKMKKASRRKNR